MIVSKKRNNMKKSIILLTLVVFVLFSITVCAEDYFCQEDADCEVYGEAWICDLDYYMCVELDLDFDVDYSDNSGSADNSTTTYDNSTDANQTITTSDNETTDVTTETTSTISSEELTLLQDQITALEERVATIETDDTSVTDQLTELSSQLEELSTTVNTLNANLQIISNDQYQTEQDLEEIMNTALAGLASVQDDLETTQSNVETLEEASEKRASWSSLLRIISLVIIVIVLFAAIAYFLMAHGKVRTGKELPAKVHKYISDHIKSGTSYSNIKDNLVKAGWPESEIKWAYDETTRKNYNEYLKSNGRKPTRSKSFAPPENQRIIVITVLTIIVMAALVLFVSNSTGHAMYYDDMSLDDFSTLVKETIDENIANNLFYTEINNLELCVEVVKDSSSSVHYEIIKTPYGHAILDAESCEDDYDFAIKFADWYSFSSVAADLSCDNIMLTHQAKGMYILPSDYVKEGFDFSGLGYEDYCSVLSMCLGASELVEYGFGC
jgi:hypothetical protein